MRPYLAAYLLAAALAGGCSNPSAPTAIRRNMTKAPCDIAAIVAAMRPDELSALQAAARHHPTISLLDFAQQQLSLYLTAPESDPRLETYFYGETIDRYTACQ